jgi:ABC-type transport system substrate-binding protein
MGWSSLAHGTRRPDGRGVGNPEPFADREKGLPHLDKMIYRPIPDTNVAVVNLKSNTLDLIDGIEPKDVAGVKARRDLVYVESPGVNYYMIRLNTSQPPFDNKAVRQALAYSIDRDSIAKGIFLRTGPVAPGPITPASWAYSKDLEGISRDIPRARALLAEAGKAGGVKFEMQLPPSPLFVRLGEVIKAQAAEAGLDITLSTTESGKMMANSLNLNYQAMLSFRTGREDPGRIHLPGLPQRGPVQPDEVQQSQDGRAPREGAEHLLAGGALGALSADPAARHRGRADGLPGRDADGAGADREAQELHALSDDGSLPEVDLARRARMSIWFPLSPSCAHRILKRRRKSKETLKFRSA